MELWPRVWRYLGLLELQLILALAGRTVVFVDQ